MIIFLDGQGRLVNKQQEDINQGSNLANIIYLVAPIPNTTQVLAYFTLPNSTVTKPRYVIAETSSPDIIKLGNENYNVWSLKLDASITAYYGQASVSFCFISGEERLNSDLINFYISKGIAVKLPEDLSQIKALDDILALVSSIYGEQDTINIELERVEGLTKVAQNTANQNKADIENLNIKIDTLHANAFVIVDSLPEPTEEHLGKIYLVLSNASADSNYYDEYIVVKTDAYEWEKIGNTSIGENIDLSDYVKNTDYANPNSVGVIKAGTGVNYPIVINATDGYGPAAKYTLFINSANENRIRERRGANYGNGVGVIAPDNMDIALKIALTESTLTLTEEEKTSACDWLGSLKKITNGGYLRVYGITGEGGQTYFNIITNANTIRQGWLSRYGKNNDAQETAINDKTCVLSTGTPIKDWHCTPKEYVDNTTTKILNSVGLWVSEPVTFAEEVAEAYKTRKTANGLNGLIDGALTKVTKIQGKTVADGNTLKDSYFQGVISTGKNWFNPNLLLVPNGWTENDGVYSGQMASIHAVYKDTMGGLLKINASGQVTVSFVGKNDTLNQNTFGIGFVYTDGTGTSDASRVWIGSNQFEEYSLTSVAGKTVDLIYVSFAFGDKIYLKDFCVQLGTDDTYIPYEESSLMFSSRLELGEWDSVDLQDKLKTTKTTKITISDNLVINKVDDTTFTIPFTENSFENAISQNLVVTENNFALVELSGLTNGVYTGLLIQTSSATSLEDFKAMLQGKPLTIAYEKKPTITAISSLTITNDKYTAWVDGSETIIQGSVDNSTVGANPIITNTYAVEYGS